GYLKNPEATKACFEGDFLKTGDQGEIDDEQYLKITGRVKDLFKTAKGKYVTPAPIELALGGNSYVAQVCVAGSGQPYPLGLIVLSEEARQVDRSGVSASLTALLNEVNEELERYEQLSKLVVVNEPWTVENEMLTPSMKVKRSAVEARYSGKFDAW